MISPIRTSRNAFGTVLLLPGVKLASEKLEYRFGKEEISVDDRNVLASAVCLGSHSENVIGAFIPTAEFFFHSLQNVYGGDQIGRLLVFGNSFCYLDKSACGDRTRCRIVSRLDRSSEVDGRKPLVYSASRYEIVSYLLCGIKIILLFSVDVREDKSVKRPRSTSRPG